MAAISRMPRTGSHSVRSVCAIFKAVSEGARQFVRIAVVADSERLTPPCGACRQIIWEFCGNVQLVLANLQGATKLLAMAEMLPEPFDSTFL